MGLKHVFHVIFIWPILLLLRGVGSPFIALGQLLRWLFYPRRSSITSGNTPAYGDDEYTADGDYTNQILSGKVEGCFNQHDRQSNRDNLKCRNRQTPSSQKDEELRADTGGLSSIDSDPQVSSLVPKDLSATFYAISVPSEALEGTENPQLVFRDKDVMLKEIKKYKGARFKLFSKEQVALNYTKSVPESVTTPVKSTFQNEDTAGNSPHPAMLEKGNWKAPKGADLVILRKNIEAGDFQSVQDMINSNPRFLISCGDTPSILHEGTRYNALHVAAKSNQPKIIKLLIQTIEDPSFFLKLYGQNQDDDDARNVRVQKLLDLYLNTPDKGSCETPLHFACKFGHKEVVEVLMSHPLTEANPKNKFGETPADSICRRVDKPSTQLRNAIKEYLKGRCYVPLYRDENNIVSPTVGTPCSPIFSSDVLFTPFGVSQTPPFSPEARISSPKSPCDPQAVVKAFAGPMSPSQADQFRKLWRSPCSRNEQTKVVREDHEKGYERVGRNLALEKNIPWSEYWGFLDSFTDLSKPEGIKLLESYLQKQNFAQNVQSSLESIQQSANNLHNQELETSTSRLQSMKKIFSDICDIENRPEDIDASFGESLLGSSSLSPKTLLTRSPKPNSSQMEKMDVGAPFENGTTMPHSQPDSPEQKELSFQEENLEEIIDTLAKDFGTKLIINTKSQPGSPIQDADLKISEVNTNMNCLFSVKDEFIDMLNAVQNQEPLSVSFMTQASCDKPTYPCLSPALHAPASPQSSTTAGTVLLNIKSPKKLIAQINGMPAKSPPELRKPLKVYIQGSVPTKLDIDVMHCLKSVPVDSEQFPYTAKWMKLVDSFSEIEKKSWTSPAKANEKKVKTIDVTGTPVMKSRTASRLEPMALFNSPSTDT